jgi:hypothetical protein
MKKHLLIGTFILINFTFLVSGAFAQFVSLDNAKNVAVAAFNERKPANRGIVDVNEIKTEIVKQNNGVPVYYIFNFVGDAFVIVSADYRIYPILGYSFESAHNPQNSPDCMDWLMGEYSQQIYDVVSQNMGFKNTEVIELWEKYENASLQKSNPAPLPSLMSTTPLTTTTWSQGCFYNDACPADNTLGTTRCGRVPTGCVATAFSQVLKYHNYPAQGTGTNSYSSNYGTLSANFGATTYNWSSMPNKLLAANPAAAQLLFHAGVAVNMTYTANSSSAYTTAVRTALVNKFKYASTAQNVTKSSYTNMQWDNLIRTEIDAQRVVIISGQDPTAGAGHAFIADGYQGTNSFHINWGWNGSSDGYFLLTALNPSSYAFNSSVGAIIGIKPISTAPTCSMATGLSASGVTSTSATLNWASGTGSSTNTFNIKYKPTTSSTWTTVTSTTNSKTITGLSPATSYHFQVQRVCSGTSTSNYSSSTTFTTLAASSSGSTVTVGTGTSTTGVAPYGTSNMDERVQFIVTKNQLVAGGYSSSSSYIKSLAFNVASRNLKTMTGFTIKMGHTTASSFSTSSFLTTSLTTVFTGNVTATNGWNTHTFNTAFQYNGSSNLLIEICWNNTSAAGNSTVRQTTTANHQILYLKTNVANGGVCSNTTGQRAKNLPNMRFAFSSSALKMFDEMPEEIVIEDANEPIQEALSMKIYPNPTAEYATIEVDGTIEPNAQLTVFDVTGKQVFTDNMNSNTYELAVENYTPGIYLVVIKNGSTNLNQKLIVKKEF